MPTNPTVAAKADEDVCCYHCGTKCLTTAISKDDKSFCCDGCKLVYELLNENGLCNYYDLQSHPGLQQLKSVRQDKYAYLDNEDIARQLYTFTDGVQAMVTLYIPGIHCSSCMWLLEHMPRLNKGIIESRLNFSAKEVTIRFVKELISLREVAELLTTIGYEPYISLDSTNKKKTDNTNKKRLYKLGVAGFCFGNIMMMSFPEYFGFFTDIEQQYAQLFRYLNLLLAIPVFFFSGSEFFVSAWKGLRQKMLNIDAPIALALIITFSRSIYEILSGTGSGFLDSLSGIVFFMLVGRIVQERAYKSISFHRDYTSYFPIAVDVVTEDGIQSKQIKDLQKNDVVRLHHDEIIPSDARVVAGTARIDYSFVTGESEPIHIPIGEMVYAGGRQIDADVTVMIQKPVAGSYLTSLWNHYAFAKNKQEENKKESTIHLLSKYFTYILLLLAAATAIYWWAKDPAMILPSVSAMLIVACPCALLLSATYTNGNLLRILSNNGLFLRDAVVIEQLGKVDHIVFDKTGTLTQREHKLTTTGHELSDTEKMLVYSVVAASKHPYSKAIAAWTGATGRLPVHNWQEVTGKGVSGLVENNKVRIGAASFTGVVEGEDRANVYIRMNDKVTACFFSPTMREGIPDMLDKLDGKYAMSLISGDNDRQKKSIQKLFKSASTLLFRQKPVEKLNYIEQLQQQQHKVLMIGDGLNDAGALQQSNVGITLADDVNNFTPACDAILDANKFHKLPELLRLSALGKKIITLSFIISILYNIVGLTISIQGYMSPMIAAILMPVSTLSIVLITTGVSTLAARRLKLS